MSYKIIPAIMSGGAGTRLWPISNAAQPKQFHALVGEDTMIQATAIRFRGPVPGPKNLGVEFLDPIVVGSADHRTLVLEQLAAIDVSPSALVLEPMGRNTAATALLAADVAASIDPDALVLLLPADHRITDSEAFIAAIARAAPTARNRIVTFGIEPSGPEIGYGYIQRGEQLDDGVFSIARFIEKPSRVKAEDMLSTGGYFWNAGIFFFHSSVVQEEFALAPDIRDGVRAALARSSRDGLDWRLPSTTFALTPSAPFDVAIMEKTTRSAVAPCDIGWADVGSFAEIWRLSPHDEEGNAVIGAAVMHGCRNCLVINEGPPVAIKGLTGMALVSTAHGTLILPLDDAQSVKALYSDIKAKGAA